MKFIDAGEQGLVITDLLWRDGAPEDQEVLALTMEDVWQLYAFLGRKIGSRTGTAPAPEPKA